MRLSTSSGVRAPDEVIGDKISIDTDEAISFDKKSKYFEYFDIRDSVARFKQEKPVLQTTLLTACMAVYIESDDKIIALHVSPSQAEDASYSAVEAYSQVKKAKLKEGSEISVMVGGHAKNFNEEIFLKKMQEMGLVVKSIKKGNSLDGTLRSEFDFTNGSLTTTSLTLPKAHPMRQEFLSFDVAHSKSKEQEAATQRQAQELAKEQAEQSAKKVVEKEAVAEKQPKSERVVAVGVEKPAIKKVEPNSAIVHAMKKAIEALSSIAVGVEAKKIKLQQCLDSYQNSDNTTDADKTIKDFVITASSQRQNKWGSWFNSSFGNMASAKVFFDNINKHTQAKDKVIDAIGLTPSSGSIAKFKDFAKQIRENYEGEKKEFADKDDTQGFRRT